MTNPNRRRARIAVVAALSLCGGRIAVAAEEVPAPPETESAPPLAASGPGGVVGAHDFTVVAAEPERLAIGTTLEIFGKGFPPESAGSYQILFDSQSFGGCIRCGLWKGADRSAKDFPERVCGDTALCTVQLALTPTVVRPNRVAVELGSELVRAVRSDEPRVYIGDVWVVFTPADGGAAVSRSLRGPHGPSGTVVRPPFVFFLFPPNVAKLAGAATRFLSIGQVEEFLGIELDDAPENGALLTAVAPSSVAARIGLQIGDVITGVGGEPVTDARTFAAAVGPGNNSNVIFELERGGALEVLAADLGEFPFRPPLATLDVVFVLAACALVFGLFILLFGGIVTWVERRIWARMQSRVGPNRVGPQGFLQWLADGLKNIQKEDLVPRLADNLPFRVAPYFVFIAVVATFAALPFSRHLIPADLNIGILYIAAVVALEVIGMLMGGWGSNSKWSLLGGMRSAAQIISYEIPGGLAILSVVLLAGTLSIQEIIGGQGGAPWNWYLCANPATFVAFFVMYIALLAEGNRTPFDLPEADSELVAGFATEYSGFRYLVFFFAEWVNLYVMGAIATILFLGGWQLPGPEWWWLGDGVGTAGATIGLGVAAAFVVLGAAALWLFKLVWIGIPRWIQHVVGGLLFLGVLAVAGGLLFVAPVTWHVEALRLVVFQVKAMLLVFVTIWIRATLPRLRIDQMMTACWKYLVPGGFVIFGFNALWVAYAPWWLEAVTSYGMAVVMFAVIGAFLWRARMNIKRTGADLDLAKRFKLAIWGYETSDERYLRVGRDAEVAQEQR